MAASAARSTDFYLYSSVDKSDDDKKFSVDVDDAKVEFACAQDLNFDGASYWFKDGESGYFNLKNRFEMLEQDESALVNAAAITALQAADATEANARAAGDLQRQNATDAEIAARVAADSAIQAALDTQEAKQESEKDASNAAIAAEVTARTAAVADEAAARAVAITAVQAQISALLANTDSTALNSLSELVQHFAAEDVTLANSTAALLARVADVEAILAAAGLGE